MFMSEQKSVSEFFTVNVRCIWTTSRPDPELVKEYALRTIISTCGWDLLRCAYLLGAPLQQRSSFSAFHHKSEILHGPQAGQIFGCFIVTAVLCWLCGSACGIDQGLKNLPTSPNCPNSFTWWISIVWLGIDSSFNSGDPQIVLLHSTPNFQE